MLPISENLIAALIGASITAAIAYARVQHDRDRVLKRSLYAMFELRALLLGSALLRPSEILDVVSKAIERKWPGTARQKQIEGLRPYLAGVVVRMRETLFTESKMDVDSQRQAVIAQIAEYEPLLALRLSGNRALKAAALLLDEECKALQAQVDALKPHEQIVVQRMLDDSRLDIYEEAAKDLREDILRVAWTISVREWGRCLFKVRKDARRLATEADRELEALADRLIGTQMERLAKALADVKAAEAPA